MHRMVSPNRIGLSYHEGPPDLAEGRVDFFLPRFGFSSSGQSANPIGLLYPSVGGCTTMVFALEAGHCRGSGIKLISGAYHPERPGW